MPAAVGSRAAQLQTHQRAGAGTGQKSSCRGQVLAHAGRLRSMLDTTLHSGMSMQLWVWHGLHWSCAIVAQIILANEVQGEVFRSVTCWPLDIYAGHGVLDERSLLTALELSVDDAVHAIQQ